MSNAPDQAGNAPLTFDEFAPTSSEVWHEQVVTTLKGAPFEKRMLTPTYEGITLNPLYTIEDTKDLKAARSYPELYPLRGNTAAGNLKKLWEVVQPVDEPDPIEANKAIKHELERGADAAAFVLSPAVRDGVDADLRGRGVDLANLADVEDLLDGIADKPLFMYTGASSLILLGMIVAAAKKQGVAPKDIKGCIGADPLGYLLQSGHLSVDLDKLWDDMATTIKWAEGNGTSLKTVMLLGCPTHNGGANAVQEVAAVMANAIACVRAMQDRGVSIDEFARHVRFHFPIGANFFMEIAKIRASRVIWAQIAEAFGSEAKSKTCEIFARTSYFTRTVYDPYVNMLRNSSEAFSAVVGGVEGFTVSCFDEALRPGTEFSRRVARNSQMMLQREFNLTDPIDPAGGSWYIEALTNELAGKIWAEVQKIEGQGGLLKSIQDGLIQKDVAATLDKRFKNLAKRADRAVGVNMYANMSEAAPEFVAPKVAPFVCKKKIDEFELEGACPVCAVVKAAEAGATMRQIRRKMGTGDGAKLTVEPIAERRWTEQFEALRAKTEAAKKNGGGVKVFLANMGPIPQHKARADFITGFMEVAAFDVLGNNGHATTDECADAAVASGAPIAVICSSDPTYPEIVPPLAKAIKAKKPDMKVYLAGEPAPEFKDSYLEAGVDGFLSVRSNCLETLTAFQNEFMK